MRKFSIDLRLDDQHSGEEDAYHPQGAQSAPQLGAPDVGQQEFSLQLVICFGVNSPDILCQAPRKCLHANILDPVLSE
jgi:hypothetical protein